MNYHNCKNNPLKNLATLIKALLDKTVSLKTQVLCVLLGIAYFTYSRNIYIKSVRQQFLWE